MPLLKTCAELEPGASLAEALCVGGRRILAAGLPLTETHISLLCEKFSGAELRVADPALDARFKFQDDLREREVADTIQGSVARFVTQLHQRFVANGDINAESLQALETIAEAAKYLRSNPVSAIVPDLLNVHLPPLARHAGRVAYFSLLLATAARDYVLEERNRQSKALQLSSKVAGDLGPLGLGAMLADVAFFEWGEAWTRLSGHAAVDRDVLIQHPARGAELLPPAFPAAVRSIIRTHHEYSDGTGYPKAVTQENLHIFSRIVTICDTYATAIADPQASPAQALREMNTGSSPARFDPVLLRCFLKLVQPFPIGSRVPLPDGRSAVVVRHNHEEPLRPTVAVAFDAAGRRLADSQMGDLLQIEAAASVIEGSLVAA